MIVAYLMRLVCKIRSTRKLLSSSEAYTTFSDLLVCMTLFHRNEQSLTSLLSQVESAMINVEYFTIITQSRLI